MYVNTISENIAATIDANSGYSVIKYAYPINTIGAINATSNRINLFSIVIMVTKGFRLYFDQLHH